VFSLDLAEVHLNVNSRHSAVHVLGQVFSELIFEGENRVEKELPTGLVFNVRFAFIAHVYKSCIADLFRCHLRQEAVKYTHKSFDILFTSQVYFFSAHCRL
jgi:hypothetical protein